MEDHADVGSQPCEWATFFRQRDAGPRTTTAEAVAARVGAYETLIRDGVTGSLVAPDDLAALTEALRHWLDDDAARQAAGRAARAHVTANHAIEGEARALVAIYHDLLARP